jgi:hypothetical protein
MDAKATDGTTAEKSADRKTQYHNIDGNDNPPILSTAIRSDGERETVWDGEAAVEVEGSEVKLTLTADLDYAHLLADRDMLLVTLTGKDLPEGTNDE